MLATSKFQLKACLLYLNHNSFDSSSDVKSLFDLYMDMTVGDFGGKSYYDVLTNEFDPYSFNFTTSGKQ